VEARRRERFRGRALLCDLERTARKTKSHPRVIRMSALRSLDSFGAYSPHNSPRNTGVVTNRKRRHTSEPEFAMAMGLALHRADRIDRKGIDPTPLTHLV
jgi:hypothetical protein